MLKPAIVAIGYNRPHLMKRLLDSIGKARFDSDDIPLIISIDESNRSDEVEQVAIEFQWSHGSKEIRRFPQRQGLRKHIIQCGDYSEKYGAVIILEDDLLVSEDFYSYVCQAHDRYATDDRICGVSLYSFGCNQFTHLPFTPAPSPSDVFLGGMVVTWGQSWTADQWKNFRAWYFEHEDKLPAANYAIPDEISGWNRSWGKYFASYMAEKGLYYVYPYVAHTTCFADTGSEHSVNNIPVSCVQVPLMQGHKTYFFEDCDHLVQYDAFYERVLSADHQVNSIPGDLICVDLNNMKQRTNGKKYIISNDTLPFKRLASYALALRPIEMNVLQEIPGNDIYLYELQDAQVALRPPKKKKYQYKNNYIRLRYDFFDTYFRTSWYYTKKDFAMRIRSKLSQKQ